MRDSHTSLEYEHKIISLGAVRYNRDEKAPAGMLSRREVCLFEIAKLINADRRRP
jgi:hypothetical protein